MLVVDKISSPTALSWLGYHDNRGQIDPKGKVQAAEEMWDGDRLYPAKVKHTNSRMSSMRD